jgi:hypothetical protein
MARASDAAWYRRHEVWLEVFVLVNLAFLAPDIYLAHSVNLFRHGPEYIPLYFSLAAPWLLLPGLFGRRTLGVVLGHLIGAVAIAIGIAGLLWHLDSQFFQRVTLQSLVYAAPFAAPLAYTGLGLLLVMNRLVDPDRAEWPYWVLLLALGGFVGNFIFSVTDHAQNGFFYHTEWIPVAASALAVGILLVPFLIRVNRSYLPVCAAFMLLQVVIGLLGFYYHTMANLRAYRERVHQHAASASIFESFVYGAPSLAPLLFPNLVLLAGLGLWVLHRHLPPAPAAVEPSDVD